MILERTTFKKLGYKFITLRKPLIPIDIKSYLKEYNFLILLEVKKVWLS